MAGNQKAIKLRIKSVQSTMQICKAMELVAASRLHKAMERAENSRPYFEALQGTLAQIAAENIDMMSIYTKEPQNDDWCFIVIAGDRGFAGGYNNNLFRLVEEQMEGHEACVLPIGSIFQTARCLLSQIHLQRQAISRLRTALRSHV